MVGALFNKCEGSTDSVWSWGRWQWLCLAKGEVAVALFIQGRGDKDSVCPR